MVQLIPLCFTHWVCLACAGSPMQRHLSWPGLAAGQSYLQSGQQMPSGEQWGMYSSGLCNLMQLFVAAVHSELFQEEDVLSLFMVRCVCLAMIPVFAL